MDGAIFIMDNCSDMFRQRVEVITHKNLFSFHGVASLRGENRTENHTNIAGSSRFLSSKGLFCAQKAEEASF